MTSTAVTLLQTLLYPHFQTTLCFPTASRGIGLQTLSGYSQAEKITVTHRAHSSWSSSLISLSSPASMAPCLFFHNHSLFLCFPFASTVGGAHTLSGGMHLPRPGEIGSDGGPGPGPSPATEACLIGIGAC